jgi:hypothetical protein
MMHTRVRDSESTRRPVIRAALLVFLLATILLSPILAPAQPPQASTQRTSQMKAVFLYNLAVFTDWPADAFPDHATPLNLCVLGDEWVPRELEYRITGKSANGRELRIRRTGLGPELRSCHLLLVGSLEKKQLPKLLQILKGTSVLTVSDIDSFIEAGGAIRFSVDEDRLHFVVNLAAIERARLKISSKLLNLSRITMDVQRSGGI